MFLSNYAPEVFDAMIDATEPFTAGPFTGYSLADSAEPYRITCASTDVFPHAGRRLAALLRRRHHRQVPAVRRPASGRHRLAHGKGHFGAVIPGVAREQAQASLTAME